MKLIECFEQLSDRRLRPWVRAMTRLAFRCDLEPDRHFLGDLDGENFLALLKQSAAALVEQIANTIESFRVVLDHPIDTKKSAGFFIGTGHKNQIPIQSDTRLGNGHKG